MNPSSFSHLVGRWWQALALFLAMAACAMSATAQEFPTKRVRILIGQPPGGGSDLPICKRCSTCRM